MNSEYRIKELCKQKKIKMSELAQRVGYSKQSSLSQAIDHGLSSNRLIDIASVLGVSVPELFVSHKAYITCPKCGHNITINTETEQK